jgi:SAM-dependent methyltransferase
MGDQGSWERAFPKDLPKWLPPPAEGKRPGGLELGSGPFSLLAWGVAKGLFDLTAVDPLADEYRELLRSRGLSYPVTPMKGFGERLGTLFDEDEFDFAYSSNALDHTQDPRACMRQLARVVRTGGVIYCEGFTGVGTDARWHGLHQHDFVPEGKELVAYDRDGRRTSLTENLGLRHLGSRVRPFIERDLDSLGYEWPGEGPNWQNHDFYFMVWEVGAPDHAHQSG